MAPNKKVVLDTYEQCIVKKGKKKTGLAYMSYMSQQLEQSGHSNQCCRPLSALTRFSSPCCLVLQSFHMGSIFPMVIQVNKSYKNQRSIGKCCVIMENIKLDKHSYLVEYS